MTKKERQYVSDLQNELLIAKALRFTNPVPPDIEPPDAFGELRKGWLFNVYSMVVVKACTSSVFHSYGNDSKTDAQGSLHLYSTKLRALMALRNSMEKDYATRLARVDRMIEEERKNEERGEG